MTNSVIIQPSSVVFNMGYTYLHRGCSLSHVFISILFGQFCKYLTGVVVFNGDGNKRLHLNFFNFFFTTFNKLWNSDLRITQSWSYAFLFGENPATQSQQLVEWQFLCCQMWWVGVGWSRGYNRWSMDSVYLSFMSHTQTFTPSSTHVHAQTL